LTFLSDSDSLVDEAAIKKLQADVEKANDPVASSGQSVS
jgi:hypothetical protein